MSSAAWWFLELPAPFTPLQVDVSGVESATVAFRLRFSNAPFLRNAL
jgi:hypothetical protein